MKVAFFLPFLLSFHLYAYRITVQQGLLQWPTVIKNSGIRKVLLLNQCKLLKLTTRVDSVLKNPVLCYSVWRSAILNGDWPQASSVTYVDFQLLTQSMFVCVCACVYSRWGLVLSEPNPGPHKGTTYSVEMLMVKEHFHDRQPEENTKLLTDWRLNQ